MEDQMISTRLRLRLPPQAAPVSRPLAGTKLAQQDDGGIVPARHFWEPGYWCEQEGIPDELCKELHPFARA